MAQYIKIIKYAPVTGKALQISAPVSCKISIYNDFSISLKRRNKLNNGLNKGKK